MMKKKFVLLLSLSAVVFTSCSIEDDGPNFHFTALEIVSAELPESFELDSTYVVTVDYLKPDECTFYEGFDVVKEELTVREVVAVGTVRTDIEACAEAVVEETATFNFKVIYTEPYTFKFYTGNDSDGEPEYLEVIVPVNTPNS